MRWAAKQALEEADAVVFVSDATRPATLPDREIGELARREGRRLIVALNQSDRVDADAVTRLVSRLETTGYRAVPTSAIEGTGIAQLIEVLTPLLPQSPPLFPAEQSTTRSVRFFAEEYVRETCMEKFHHEIPYGIACRVDEFREEGDPV